MTLSELITEELAAIGQEIDASILERKFILQSGRCAVSYAKLSLEPGRFDSAKLARLDSTKPWCSTNIRFVSAIVLALNNINVVDYYGALSNILESLQNFSCNIDAPTTQVSIHSQFLLERAGFVCKRSGQLSFKVSEDAASTAHVMVTVRDDSVFITVDSFGHHGYLTSGSTLNWTGPGYASLSFNNGVTGGNSIVMGAGAGAGAMTYSTGGYSSYSHYVNGTLQYTTMAPQDEKSKFLIKNFIIPIADPDLFSKIADNVLSLLVEARKFL